MKRTITILLFVSLLTTFSAYLKGVSNRPTTPTIVGNWTLDHDSTTIQFWGLWQGKPDTGINYAGAAGDHYNFMQNGKVFIKEGSTLDTGTYKSIATNKIELNFTYLNGQGNPPNGWVEDFMITALTGHSLTLTGGTFVSPETSSTHTLYLKK
jgi:hypothetical protein